MPYAEWLAVGRNFHPPGDFYPKPPERKYNADEIDGEAKFRRAWYAYLETLGGNHRSYDPSIRMEPARAQSLPPVKYRLKRRMKYLPDRLNSQRSHGNFTASNRFKECVEAVEPNTHLFFPLQILQPDLEPWPEMYWMFECNVVIQAIIVEESPGMQWKPLEDPRNGYVRRATSRGFNPLEHDMVCSGYRIDRDAIAGHHIWRDPMSLLREQTVFFSDEFAAVLRKAKMRGFRLNEYSYAAPIERRVPPYHHINELRWSA